MAEKKKEGFNVLKDTTGGKRREDRNAASKTYFDPISIDSTNVLTVIYLLKSPEENIVIKAIASLEGFGKKDLENLKLLQSQGIFEYLLPLITKKDFVVRRFALKLIGMLCRLEEFREQILKVENILKTFKDILKTEKDVVLQEYASLTLAELSSEYLTASELLKLEDCIETLFLRITATDPDIQKNCLDIDRFLGQIVLGNASTGSVPVRVPLVPSQTLTEASSKKNFHKCSIVQRKQHSLHTYNIQKHHSEFQRFEERRLNCEIQIMNHLLNDVNGIEAFVESPKFEIKLLLNLVFSSYPAIQALTIEVLTQLTSWCRDTRILFAFRDVSGIELTLDILEKEEWSDLYQGALNLLINVTDCPDMCDYLQQSGCLSRLIKLLDNTKEKLYMEKMLGVLARMSQPKRGRLALHSVEMEERFVAHLEDTNEGIQESSSLGIANMAQYLPSLDNIMNKNPVKQLIGIIINPEKNSNLRNMAAYALNTLSNADERAPEALIQNDEYQNLLVILTENATLPTELCQNVIQVFIGISHTYRFKTAVINEKVFYVLLSCLPNGNANSNKDASLQVDVLECLSEYLTESEARSIFNQLGGPGIALNCLRSKFASIREWAGHLVVIMSQSKEFVKAFIQKDGLEWMLKEKNTMYSMPSWQSAIETIFSNYLPAKFAYTGRLDFHDITQDGFYVIANSKTKFVLLDHYFEENISPIVPIYVANFNLPISSPKENDTNSVASNQISVHKTMEPQNLKKNMKGADRNSLEEYSWKGPQDTESSESYGADKTEESFVRLGKLFPDVYLNELLDNLKKKIAKEELSIGDISWFSIHPKLISKRAKIIAEFVADEMSGPESDPVCSVHYKNTYVNELKYYLGTNIIPLGLIRMGDYLERAMLFKVLADRIGFPCALVRGSYGRAWIEITIPVINVEDIEGSSSFVKDNSLSSTPENKSSNEKIAIYESKKSIRYLNDIQCSESNSVEGGFWFPKLKLDHYKGFPNQLLKPNAIIDLIVEPGKILNINSFEAKEYCGDFLFAK